MKKLNTLLFLVLLCFGLNAQTSKVYAKSIKKHRKEYKKEFRKSDESPVYGKNLRFIRFFEADENYKLVAEFTATPDSEPFEMATYAGTTKPYRKYGVLTFTLNGASCELSIYQSLKLIEKEEYKDYLFLPFLDHTSGESTYGGGRYMDFRLDQIENGKLILDFNKCYNPWCAYSDGYFCPVPPAENVLEVAIEAGERNYEGKKLYRRKTKR